MVGSTATSTPGPPVSTAQSPRPSGERATTTANAHAPRSGTMSLTPVRVHPSAFGAALVPTDSRSSNSHGPSGSAHASVAASPAAIRFRRSGMRLSAGAASVTLVRYGPGYSALPSSSMTTVSSRNPIPAPPASSGHER